MLLDILFDFLKQKFQYFSAWTELYDKLVTLIGKYDKPFFLALG